MAIEKWRPAKAGDEGLIARFRYAYDGHWRVGTLEGVKIDDDIVQVTEFHNGFDWFLHCEVLDAYLSDEEVERIGCGISACVYPNRDDGNPYAKVIRRHFASEEGGE